MKRFLFLLIISIPASLSAQYYYKDIIGTRDAGKLINLYRQNKVQTVVATGFDENGLQSKDFYEKQTVLDQGNIIKIDSRTEGLTNTQYLKFDAEGNLVSVSDTNNTLVSVTSYTYDGSNRITLIKNSIVDTSIGINETEEHQWEYNSQGSPVRMLRIFNKDTLELRFKLDEDGNVIEEQTFKKRLPGETIYYYYDDKNRMTDIVRYNNKAKKLLPDYMFEYSPADQVIQKITILQNQVVGYIIWRYSFDEKGLKVKEGNFNKDKQMIGKIEYRYTFGS